MNLAAGAVLLSVLLLSMALLCRAQAADFQAGQAQRKSAPARSDRTASIKADLKLSRQENREARSEETVKFAPAVSPALEEKKDVLMENPVDPSAHSIKFKGVRG